MQELADLIRRIAIRRRIRRARKCRPEGFVSAYYDSKNWLSKYSSEHSFNVVCALFLAVWTQYVLFGLAVPEVVEKNLWSGLFTALETTLALTLFGLWFTHARFLKWLGIIWAGGLAIMSPIRYGLGEPMITPRNFDVLLGSTVEEAVSFISSIPPTWYAIPLLLLGISFFLIGKCTPLSDPEYAFRHKLTFPFLILLIPLIFASSALSYMTHSFQYKVSTSESTAPAWTMTGTLQDWKIVDNYVLIVGESLRADAMSLFGNRYATNLYLDQVPSRSIRLISPSYSTMESVPRLLSLSAGNDDEVTKEGVKATVEPFNNVLTLAKDAGFRTYWFSAQAQTRSLDLPISQIAKSADESSFDINHDDFALVALLEGVLERQDEGRKLFVLHTYGSHEDVCDRVADFGKPFQTGKGELMDCYLASTLKTDRLIKQVAHAFKSRGESYSIIYVSDHAVDMKSERGEVITVRNAKSQKQYEVPFVELGDTVTSGLMGIDQQSAMKFPSYFPTWIGITTNRTEAGWDFIMAPPADLYVVNPDGNFTSFDKLQAGTEMNVLLAR